MIFPRKTKRIDSCLVLLREHINHGGVLGEPLFYKVRVEYKKDEWWRASRLSYHLNVAHIPRKPSNKGKRRGLVLHTCDHDWCVEPSHLYKGSAKRNMQDRKERGRNTWKQTPESNLLRSLAMRGKQNTLGKTWTWRK